MINGYNKEQNYSQTDLTQTSFIDSPKKESKNFFFKRSVYFNTLFFIFFISIGYLLFFYIITKKLINNDIGSSFYILLLYFCIGISILTLTNLLINIILYFYKEKDSFFYLIFEKQLNILKIISTVGILTVCVTYLEESDFKNFMLFLQTSNSNKNGIILRNTSYFLKNGWIFILVYTFLMTIRLLLLEGIKYTTNLSTYRKRLVQSNKDMEKIYILNSVTGKSIIYKSEKWIRMIFKKLSPEGNPLTLETLNYFFNLEDSKNIMSIFDLNKNNQVSEEQFTTVWLNVIDTKDDINMLHANRIEVTSKLSRLFYGIVIFLTLFISCVIITFQNKFNTFISFLTFLVPFHFLFGTVPGELFKSIVYVFMTRPFEVGDFIKFDGKKYLVKEIGLMYSTLKHNSLSINIPNIKIAEEKIVNFKLSEFYEKKFVFTCSVDFFKSNRTIIRDKIRTIIKKKPYNFDNRLKIIIVKIIDDINLKFKIVVFVNPNSINYEQELDNLRLEISNIIKSITINTFNRSIVKDI